MKYLLLMILSLFVLQACSDGSTSGDNKECKSDSDCKEWQLCDSENKCALKEGMCGDDNDCSGEIKVKCSDEHFCIEPVEVEECTADGNECENNTNGKIICIDLKCAEPIEVDDCTEDGDKCANNTNGKTFCGDDKKCQLPPEVEDCTENSECETNTNGKTICVDLKCIEPVEVDDCTENSECENNTNGATVCVDLKCVEPVEIDACTENSECEANTNGKTICVDLKCAEPVEVKDCTESSECENNTNGAIVCDTENGKCVIDGCEVSEEVCDGIDNDCDGDIDEDLVASDADKQFGVCAGSKKVCKLDPRDNLVKWMEPDYSDITNYEAEETICDELDNDCDNSADEGCGGCTDGDVKNCGTTDVGPCEYGQQTCEGGVWGDCVGGINPAQEVCDGKDNDCNGITDDNLVEKNADNQNGVCAGSKKVCKLDTDDNVVKWMEPDYSQISNYEETEVSCDELDNDCDNETDENLRNTYYKDEDGDGFGVASDTVDACSVPEGYVESNNDCNDDNININPDADEVCDGIDNNCNGQKDEGFANTDGDPLPDCMDTDDDNDGFNDDEDCAPLDEFINPAAQEICDGKDNNCNGNIDNDDDSLEDAPNAQNQDGICAGSKKVCSGAGGWINPDYTALDGYEADDASCDGVDNNCSGENDEGYVETETSCGVGECATIGNLECQGGVEVDTCVAGEPIGEICDGLDNNCNGDIDEGLVAPDADMQDGVCSGSKKVCGDDGGGTIKWNEPDYFAYSQNYQLEEQSCDDLDNDCDGSIDENPIELCTVSEDTVITACVKDVETGVSSCKEILSGVDYLSLADQHSCAFNSDTADGNGLAVCWGYNNNGQLGSGNNVTSYIPVKVDNSINAAYVMDTDNGRMSNCSVIADGTIKCWGRNTYGQLGNNSNDNSNIPVTVVKDLFGSSLEYMDSVSVGGYHACGVYDNRENDDNFVYCWGLNNSGQLGDNTTSDKNYAVRVKTLSSNGHSSIDLINIDKVVVGLTHSCALMKDSTVYCWGRNDKGQLGDNSDTDSELAKKVDGLENVVDIVAGDDFTCANYIADDVMDIKCWGDNSYSQIKDSLLTKYDEPVSLNMNNVNDFMASGGYICYVLEDGGVLCRGENSNHQIGDDSPSMLSGTKGYQIVSGATGKQHLCVIVNSENVEYKAVMCRGLNDKGQAGVGYSSDNIDTDSAYLKNFEFVLAEEE